MAKIIQNALLDESALRTLSADHLEWIYNSLDVCVTHEVHTKLNSVMDNVAANTYAFSKELQAPVLEMTLRGTLIDLERRDAVLVRYKREINQVAHNLDRIISEGIGRGNCNWRSPAQLSKLLYGELGIKPVLKRNAQGRMVPTVNRDALEKLCDYFFAEPICLHILKLRDLEKKRQFLETQIDRDNRIRTSLNITGTNTGRFASSISDFGTGTNVQNIDRELRSVFIADKGMKFANLDLEQADARNVGAICWNLFVNSHGPRFAGAYLDACEGGDLHTAVCKMVWTELAWTGDPDADKKIAEQNAYRDMSYRDLAKRLGHGTNYLGTPRTMAKHTKVAVALIEDFQRKYFLAFPCIKLWHNHIRKEIANNSSLTTLLGRRRFFYGRSDDEATIREAVAYEPQSLTADEINLGMLRLWRANKVQLLIQVHDSILFQFPEEQESEIIPWAKELLKTSIELTRGRKFSVPVDAKIGWNWGEVGKKGENPDGLTKWTGQDTRKRILTAPNTASLLERILAQPAGAG